MTWEDFRQEELEQFRAYLKTGLKPVLGALPENFDFTNKTQEEVEEAQGGMNPWGWYRKRGYSYPENPAPSVRVFGNLFVKRHLYSKSPDNNSWIERDPSEQILKIQKIEKSDAIETLEIGPFYGSLCCVIREWIPYQGTSIYKADIKDDLESNVHWNKIIQDWPVDWKSRMEFESGGIIKTEDDVFVSQYGPCKIKNPITGKTTEYDKNIVFYGNYDSVLPQIEMELACRGLPWDEKTTLYTLWRILGGLPENAPLEILPERGGWVETLIVTHGTRLSDKHNVTINDLGKRVPLSDFGNQDFVEETVVMPFPYHETISNGAWMRDSRWDKQAGLVRMKHQKWIDVVISSHGFILPSNIHHKIGSLPAQDGEEKRGRPRKNIDRWKWYELSLGNPLVVNISDIKERARKELKSHQSQSFAKDDKDLTTIILEIRTWLRTAPKVKIDYQK